MKQTLQMLKVFELDKWKELRFVFNFKNMFNMLLIFTNIFIFRILLFFLFDIFILKVTGFFFHFEEASLGVLEL